MTDFRKNVIEFENGATYNLAQHPDPADEEGEKMIPNTCRSCGRRVFFCVSHPVRADDQMGLHVATFYSDGSVACREHA